jgi:chaperonin GroES
LKSAHIGTINSNEQGLPCVVSQLFNIGVILIMNLRPLSDRVVVRRMEEEKTTVGGILLPDSAKEKPAKGEILAVGEGKRSDNGSIIPMSVKVGDNVLFGKYAGQEVKVDGADVLVMREDDIIAVFN